MANSSNLTYRPSDFTHLLRTREASILAAGELNRQLRESSWDEGKFFVIFRLDRKRKPLPSDSKRFQLDLTNFLSSVEKFHRAASWHRPVKRS